MKKFAPATPYGYTIFCDDIRTEVGNKHSIIGIYSESINLHSPLPFTFSKFALYVHYSERPGESSDPVTLSIYLPGSADDRPIITGRIPIEQMRSLQPPENIQLEDPLISVNLQIVLNQLKVENEGLFRVRAYRGDLEIKLGAIRVLAPKQESSESSD